MKKLIFTLFAFALVGVISAQSLSLAHEDGTPIANGEAISVQGDIFEDLVAHAVITNDADFDINVLCKKVHIDVPETGMVMLCWGLCFAPTVFVSPDPIEIPAGATNDTDFAGHFNPQGVASTASVMWVFYDELNPDDSVSFIANYTAASNTFDVVFNANMNGVEEFDAATDMVYVSGTPFDWAEPGTNEDAKMLDEDGDLIYTLTIAMEEAGDIQYKYFKNAGWAGGEWEGDPNRSATIEGETIIEDFFGFYNVPITFNVDMTNAEDFDPAVDSIFVTGSLLDWAEPGTNPAGKLISTDVENIFSVTVLLDTPGEIQYKYFKNAGWSGGEWEGDPNRIEFISDTISELTINNVWASNSDIGTSIVDNVNVYPNPFQNVLNIENMENVKSLAVYNMAGQVVKHVEVSGSNLTMNLENLNSGVYFVVFTDAQNNSGAIKLVRE